MSPEFKKIKNNNIDTFERFAKIFGILRRLQWIFFYFSLISQSSTALCACWKKMEPS